MLAAFVPDHSGGSATVLHRFPLCPFLEHPQLIAVDFDPVRTGSQGNNPGVNIASRTMQTFC